MEHLGDIGLGSRALIGTELDTKKTLNKFLQESSSSEEDEMPDSKIGGMMKMAEYIGENIGHAAALKGIFSKGVNPFMTDEVSGGGEHQIPFADIELKNIYVKTRKINEYYSALLQELSELEKLITDKATDSDNK